jgi:hypothetical protein
MTPYKYKKIAGYAILVALIILGSLSAAGQYGRTPKIRMTPRAVAVLEFDSKGNSRLFPVMIMVEGKFYDASFYAMRPVPLTLYSETVYEGQKSGMGMGLFTVGGARRLGDLWWGVGDWKPFASSSDKKKGAGKPGAKGDTKSADAKPALKDDNDSDRPTLKRPTTEAPPPASAKPEVKAEAKPGAEPKPAANTQSESGPDDPNRPTLRRGHAGETVKADAEDAFVVLDPKKAPAAAAPVETLVAVSDPVPTDTRPFDMNLSPEEQEHLGKQLTEMAWAEVKKFAGGRLTFPANAVFSQVKIRSFDLDYSNNPLLVYSAEYLVAPGTKFAMGGSFAQPPTFYVTLVGKVDLEGRLNKLFAATTDSLHLDAYSRLEFIDAVDADGDSRGELLFRRISDIGRKYVIFRATPYWAQMFEGASGQ